MATAIQLETISPDASLVESSGDQGAQDLDAGHGGIPEYQVADEAEMPTNTNPQARKVFRLLLSSFCQKFVIYVGYWVMIFTGFAVIIAGMTSRHENGWGLAFIISYTCWTLAVSLCIYLDLKTGAFLKRSTSHLACCATTLYFFVSALQISSTDLPMFIPVCVNLGLLASFGLQQMSLPTKLQILSCLGCGYNYQVIQQRQQHPILPLVEPNATAAVR